MAAGDGLVSMTPTSIAHSGTSASINADGGVDFTAVTELNLNGVFTSDYDNYLIVMSGISSTLDTCRGRLRVSGSDASGSDYARQYLIADGGSAPSGLRQTGLTSLIAFPNIATTDVNGYSLVLYGPALAQPTATRVTSVRSTSGAVIQDEACTHSLSTAYDGITLFLNTHNMTGTVHVFGYEE